MGDDIEGADLSKIMADLREKNPDWPMKVIVDERVGPPLIVSKRLMEDSYVRLQDLHTRDLYARDRYDSDYNGEPYPQRTSRDYVHGSRPMRDPAALDKYWQDKNARDVAEARTMARQQAEHSLVVQHVADMTACMVREDPSDDGYENAVAFNEGLRRAIEVVSEHLALTAPPDGLDHGPSADT